MAKLCTVQTAIYFTVTITSGTDEILNSTLQFIFQTLHFNTNCSQHLISIMCHNTINRNRQQWQTKNNTQLNIHIFRANIRTSAFKIPQLL